MACDAFSNAVSKIAVGATGPLSVSGDAGSVTQRPTMDLILAANYLAGICASQTRRLGVRYTHLRPAGTVLLRSRAEQQNRGFEV